MWLAQAGAGGMAHAVPAQLGLALGGVGTSLISLPIKGVTYTHKPLRQAASLARCCPLPTSLGQFCRLPFFLDGPPGCVIWCFALAAASRCCFEAVWKTPWFALLWAGHSLLPIAWCLEMEARCPAFGKHSVRWELPRHGVDMGTVVAQRPPLVHRAQSGGTAEVAGAVAPAQLGL